MKFILGIYLKLKSKKVNRIKASMFVKICLHLVNMSMEGLCMQFVVSILGWVDLAIILCHRGFLACGKKVAVRHIQKVIYEAPKF